MSMDTPPFDPSDYSYVIGIGSVFNLFSFFFLFFVFFVIVMITKFLGY